MARARAAICFSPSLLIQRAVTAHVSRQPSRNTRKEMMRQFELMMSEAGERQGSARHARHRRSGRKRARRQYFVHARRRATRQLPSVLHSAGDDDAPSTDFIEITSTPPPSATDRFRAAARLAVESEAATFVKSHAAYFFTAAPAVAASARAGARRRRRRQ